MACRGEQVVRTTRHTAAIKHCHRCNGHFNAQPLLTEHLKTCNPWALEQGKQRKTFLPELKNGRSPTVHFKQHHQVYDVPVYVVADCETYREGNSNAHVASFAFCVVGSDLCAPPFHYRTRWGRGPSRVAL